MGVRGPSGFLSKIGLGRQQGELRELRQPMGWRAERASGFLPANSWGLHDMLGNVDEWVQDCWNGDYIGAPSDGTAWIEGDCEQRVVRGGNWMMGGAPRIPVRNRWPASMLMEIVGFRVARTLDR